MNLEIKETEYDVLIVDPLAKDDEYEYDIPKFALTERRNGDLSEWVMQLNGRIWIDEDPYILYKLAAYIHLNHPDHKINWHKTFFIVEKMKFLNEVGPLLKPKAEETKDNDLTYKINLGIEQSTEENRQMIDKIVFHRLKEFGLVD